jgi:hypothetical protein
MTPAATQAFEDRLAIVWLADKVEKFRAIRGRFPIALRELSDPRLGDVLQLHGALPRDPIRHLPYNYRSPARSGAAFEIQDNGGLDPGIVEALHYPGRPGDSLVFDSKLGMAVRNSPRTSR